MTTTCIDVRPIPPLPKAVGTAADVDGVRGDVNSGRRGYEESQQARWSRLLATGSGGRP